MSESGRSAPDDRARRSSWPRVQCKRHVPTPKSRSAFGITDIRFIIAVTIEPEWTMNPNSIPLQPSALRASLAYLLAVTAASTYIVVSRFPHVIAQRASSGLLHPLWQTILVLLSDCLFIVIIGLPAAFFSALPCVLLNLLARRYHFRNPLFYVFVGCGLALLAVFPFISVTSGWTWYTDPPNPSPPLGFWPEVHSVASVFGVAGAVAGLTFWLVAGRYFLGKSALA
ncbi:hypothetical protein OKW26_006466 [Paraburkholderia sp. 32]